MSCCCRGCVSLAILSLQNSDTKNSKWSMSGRDSSSGLVKSEKSMAFRECCCDIGVHILGGMRLLPVRMRVSRDHPPKGCWTSAQWSVVPVDQGGFPGLSILSSHDIYIHAITCDYQFKIPPFVRIIISYNCCGTLFRTSGIYIRFLLGNYNIVLAINDPLYLYI